MSIEIDVLKRHSGAVKCFAFERMGEHPLVRRGVDVDDLLFVFVIPSAKVAPVRTEWDARPKGRTQ